MKKPTFLVIIPARSGSKGIKNKNIRPFVGKPLLYYTIHEAKKCKELDRIIVSTDSPKYAAIAKKFGAEVPYLRPKHLASDKSLIVDTVIELLRRLEKEEKYKPDYIVLLQTTSPLRTYEDIDTCIKTVLTKKCDAVMTMTPTEQLLYTIDGGGYLKLLFNKQWLAFTNRQSIPATYKINGPAVLIVKRISIPKHRSFLKGKIAGVVMEKWKSPDLDNEEDFIAAEILYKNRNRFSR